MIKKNKTNTKICNTARINIKSLMIESEQLHFCFFISSTYSIVYTILIIPAIKRIILIGNITTDNSFNFF